MAKPKITRLGDPANPYTKKKVTAQEAARSARANGAKPAPKRKAESAPAKKKTPQPQEGPWGRRRRREIDRAIGQ